MIVRSTLEAGADGTPALQLECRYPSLFSSTVPCLSLSPLMRRLVNLDAEADEYTDNQLITSLYLLSSTTLFGALPLPLSLPAEHPSVAELTGWCESRAALEFSRREGVKGGARVVLDILKGQAR